MSEMVLFWVVVAVSTAIYNREGRWLGIVLIPFILGIFLV